MRVALKVWAVALTLALLPTGAEFAVADDQLPVPNPAPSSVLPDASDPTQQPTEPAATSEPDATSEPADDPTPTEDPAPPTPSETRTVSAAPVQPAGMPADVGTYRPGCDTLPAQGMGDPVMVGAEPDLVGWTPVEGAMFSNPNTADGQWVVVNQMIRGLQAARAGSTIHVAMYSTTRLEASTAAVRAFCRGVNIHWVTDDHGMTYQASQTLRNVLGLGYGSSFKACYLSCSSNYTWKTARLRVVTTINPLYRPYMHAKYFTFDDLAGVPYVSMLSSGNFTTTQMIAGWNNIYTAVNDPATFDFLNNRFDEMVKDTTGNDYGRRSSSSPPAKTSYFFPWGVKNPRSSKQTVTSKTDPYARFLDSIKCTGAAKGYGTSKRRTQVLVSMYQWTSSRLYLARRLKSLKNKGCDVRVLMSAGEWDLEVMPLLRARGGAGPIPIRNGDRHHTFIHSKYIIVNGRVGSNRHYKAVWTGSGNWTKSSLRFSNESSILVTGDQVYSEFKANWNQLWSSKNSSAITKLKKKKTVKFDP